MRRWSVFGKLVRCGLRPVPNSPFARCRPSWTFAAMPATYSPCGPEGEQFNTSLASGTAGPEALSVLRRRAAPGGRVGATADGEDRFCSLGADRRGVGTTRAGRAGGGSRRVARPLASRGNAWQLALDELSSFLDRVLALTVPPPDDFPRLMKLLDWTQAAPAPELQVAMGAVLEDAAVLGRRTAEMHGALASVREIPISLRAVHAALPAVRSTRRCGPAAGCVRSLTREAHHLPTPSTCWRKPCWAGEMNFCLHFRALTTERLDAGAHPLPWRL